MRSPTLATPGFLSSRCGTAQHDPTQGRLRGGGGKITGEYLDHLDGRPGRRATQQRARTVANFLYVDNSNVWIEGMHVSAVKNGLAPDIWIAQQEKINDFGWRLDFGKLYEFAGGQASEVGRAVLFGSRPPPNDSLWSVARRKGFDVVVYDRSIAGREKKVDTSIATTVVADSYELMRPGADEVTLVAGDADYVPTVEQLRGRGFDVYVVFWEHASRELKEASTRFVALNEYLEHLALSPPS